MEAEWGDGAYLIELILRELFDIGVQIDIHASVCHARMTRRLRPPEARPE